MHSIQTAAIIIVIIIILKNDAEFKGKELKTKRNEE